MADYAVLKKLMEIENHIKGLVSELTQKNKWIVIEEPHYNRMKLWCNVPGTKGFAYLYLPTQNAERVQRLADHLNKTQFEPGSV